MSDQGEYDRNQRAAERAHDLANDLGKRLIEASTRDAQEAIKVVVLVNSGAAVAILAFIGTLASRKGITGVGGAVSTSNSAFPADAGRYSRRTRPQSYNVGISTIRRATRAAIVPWKSSPTFLLRS
jgi:hypothetical protein